MENINNTNNQIELSDNEVNELVNTAAECRTEENDMLKYKDSVEVNPDAELVESTQINDIGDDVVQSTVDNYPSMKNVSLFDIDENGNVIHSDEENSAVEVPSIVKELYSLDDEEVFKMVDVIKATKENPNYPVYVNLPEQIKQTIRNMAAANNIPKSHYNSIARVMINEFMKDSDVEAAFIDLEEAIKEACKIPSLMDLYTEHTSTMMRKTVPEIVDKIKDTEPDKAVLLDRVRECFEKACNFSMAMEEYTNNARVRKAVRKNDKNFKRTLDEFNFKNEKSNFKMNDVRELPIILTKILIDEPKSIYVNYEEDKIPAFAKKCIDTAITDIDIQKFCIMICKSCENMNPRDVVDASYMYYMMKNIIVLKHTEEAKTDFAAELIINICDAIAFIRNKEVEFNAPVLD